MKVQPSVKQEVAEVFNQKTNETIFLTKKNKEWQKITQEEYNKIIGVK